MIFKLKKLTNTEDKKRLDVLKAEVVKLVGTDSQKIVDAAKELIYEQEVYEFMSKNANSYAYGKASEKIVNYKKNRVFP